MTVAMKLAHFKTMHYWGDFRLLKVSDNEPPPFSSGHYFTFLVLLLMPCRTKQP